jgi:hypothetical protein
LDDAGARDAGGDLVSVDARGAEVAADWDDLRSPESYLGLARTKNFASSGGAVRGKAVDNAPTQLKLNQWALTGNWTFENEPVVLNDGSGRIVFQFHARDVNLVMGPTTPGKSIDFRVLIDGQSAGAAHGFDVDEQGHGTLTYQRLYQLIRHPLPVSERRFEIEFLDAGVAGYAFTFG